MAENKRTPFVWAKQADTDMDAYYAMLHVLIEQGHQGKWVLIYEQKLESVHPTFEKSLEAGYALAGLDRFLVKEIEPLTEFEKKFWRDRAAGEAEYQSWLRALTEPVDLREQFEKLPTDWEFPPVRVEHLSALTDGAALRPGLDDYFWECVFLGYQLGKGLSPCR